MWRRVDFSGLMYGGGDLAVGGGRYKVLPFIGIFFCGVPFFIGLLAGSMCSRRCCLDNSIAGGSC